MKTPDFTTTHENVSNSLMFSNASSAQDQKDNLTKLTLS